MRVLPPIPSPKLPSTEDLWRARVADWRRSGLTMDAFCADKPYAASTMRWWSSRLRHAPSPTFIEVRPRHVAPSDIVIEVGSARVRVEPGFDPVLLASVVAALTGDAR